MNLLTNHVTEWPIQHQIQVTSNEEILLESPAADIIKEIQNPPKTTLTTSRLFRSKKTKRKSLEIFIEAMENDIFSTNNIRKPRSSLNENEKLALKEIKPWDDKVRRVQEKRFLFCGFLE